jgi:hypothetical protein
MSGQYILDDKGNPVPESNIRKWGTWMQNGEQRRVAWDVLESGVKVSTVFLGLDHGWDGGPPVLWETMVFGGPHDEYQERYTSLAAEKEGHKRALQLAADTESNVQA